MKGSELMDLSGGIQAKEYEWMYPSGGTRVAEWMDLSRGIRADESNQRDLSGVSEWSYPSGRIRA